MERSGFEDSGLHYSAFWREACRFIVFDPVDVFLRVGSGLGLVWVRSPVHGSTLCFLVPSRASLCVAHASVNCGESGLVSAGKSMRQGGRSGVQVVWRLDCFVLPFMD